MIQVHERVGAQLRVLSPSIPQSRAQEIRDYLARLLATPQFSSASRRGQLLRYLVEHSLAGDAGKVSEYGIGFDVFQKPPSFDPRIESLVRTEFSRLRQRIKDYYAAEGQNDAVIIDFPPRSYAAKYEFRDVASLPKLPVVPQLLPAAAQPAPGTWRRNTLIAIVLFVAIGAVPIQSWRRYEKQFPVRRPIHAIVVLPFENYSPHPEDEYIADGMTEELTNNLAQGGDLRVVARTSAFAFKGKGEDVRAIGRQLNVDAVLEGSFTRDGERMRITAQLNRASDGCHLWSHSYETDSKDLLEVQEEVANSITSAIEQVGGSAAPQVRALPTNLEAPDRIAARF